MSFFNQLAKKVKLEKAWKILLLGKKFNDLSKAEQNLFGSDISQSNQRQVFNVWKNNITDSDKEKAEKYKSEYLEKYSLPKDWSKVSKNDKEDFFGGSKDKYNSWYDENYSHLKHDPVFGIQQGSNSDQKGTPNYASSSSNSQGTPNSSSSSNPMSKIADAKNNTEAKTLALKDGKITDKEAKALENRGVSLDKIQELRDELIKSLRIEVMSDGQLTKKEINQLRDAGVPQGKIDKMIENIDSIIETGGQEKDDVPRTGNFKEDTPLQINPKIIGKEIETPSGETIQISTAEEIDNYNNSLPGNDGNDGKNVGKGKHTLKTPDGRELSGSWKEIAEAAGTSVPKSWLIDHFKWSDLTPDQQSKFQDKQAFTGRREQEDFFSKKLTNEGVQDALNSYSADQLLTYYQNGKLNVGKNALASIKAQAEADADARQIGGLDRIGVNKYNPSEQSTTHIDGPAGIYYQTYTKDGETDVLRIGNLRGHRPEGGSPYKDIKMVDYDASIRNYDPSKKGSSTSSFVTGYDKKTGKVTFKDFEPKRHDYTANTVKEDGILVRSDQQREEYALRGIADGGRVKVTRIDGEKIDVKTKDNGLLERLTLTDNGEYKVTKADYPTEIKSSSYSDLLASKSGKAALNLSIQANISKGASAYSKPTRDSYIRSGRSKLNT